MGHEIFDLEFVQVAAGHNLRVVPAVAVKYRPNFPALFQKISAIEPNSLDTLSQRRRNSRTCQRIVSVHQKYCSVGECFEQGFKTAPLAGENLCPGMRRRARQRQVVECAGQHVGSSRATTHTSRPRCSHSGFRPMGTARAEFQYVPAASSTHHARRL